MKPQPLSIFNLSVLIVILFTVSSCGSTASSLPTSTATTISPTSAALPPANPPARDLGQEVLLSAGEIARNDLAQIINGDASQITIEETVTRTLAALTALCPQITALETVANQDQAEAQWITLTYKNKTYHYLALGELVLYCEP